MKNLFLILLFISNICFAADLPRPPIDRDLSLQTEQYFKNIADNQNNLQVVNTIPDTTRLGKKGDIVLYISGSTYRIYANVDGSTSWKFTTLN